MKYIQEHLKKAALALKLITLSLTVGIICGLVGGIFHRTIDFATEFRVEHSDILYLLPFAGLVIVFLYNKTNLKKDPGTNNIISGVRSEENIPFAIAPNIFFATIITHLFGGSAGREGAALQLGGAIGSATGNVFKTDCKLKPLIILAGMSGVFSALFGTPLTAVVFAIELCCVGTMFYSSLLPCFISAYTALFISKMMGTNPVRLAVADIPSTNINTIISVIILGFACACLGILFCKAMKHTHKLAEEKIPNSYLRIFVGGAIIVVLTKLLGTYDYNGAGMDIIIQATNGNAVPYAFLLKILFTAITIGFGYKGGEIVPTFFIGATFGCVLAPILNLSPSFSAAVGMAALFTAVVNCPIASLILACEIFGSNGILLYAAAIFVSFTFSGYSSLYASQMFSFSKNCFETLNRKSK